MDGGICLRFDINQAPVHGVKGDDRVLPLVIAEQDKGTPQTLGLSVIIHVSGKVAALILIKDKLIAAGGISENEIPELLEGWIFEGNILAI